MTPYEVLGIGPEATEEEAEDAYYRLLLIHHPDLHQGGSADEMAAAEARTLALNLAMQQVRRSFDRGTPGEATFDAPAGGAGHRDPHRGGTRTRMEADPSAAGPSAGAAKGSGAASATEADWASSPPPPTATCPFCGDGFTDGHRLRTHVATLHKVRLDHRPRSRIGRSLDRFTARWQHISIWYVVPFNALIALMIAVAVAPLDTDFAYWVFGVAMAPTFILLLDRNNGAR